MSSAPDASRAATTIDGHVRRIVGFGFLALQLGLVICLRIDPAPWLRVAPAEGQTQFRLFVTEGTESLSAAAVTRRYHLPRTGVTTLTPEGLHSVVRRHEAARAAATGQPTDIFVRLHTRDNGAREEVWLWPEN